MKLVEADAEGPTEVEAEVARPRPPRPERRRVVVSLFFTVAVLASTVITIYTVFPERHNQLVTEAIHGHRLSPPWQLERPGAHELGAWAAALLGERAPIPEPGRDLTVVGARALRILNQPAALLRYRVAGTEVSYLVQRTRDLASRRVSRLDQDDRVESWRRGAWTCVAIGPAATAATWMPALEAP